MAIDTREKRASVVAIPYPWAGVSVTVNAAKDQEWRQQVGWSYSGILAGATLPIPAVLEDLTTLWCQDWQPAIHATGAARRDDTGQLAIDLDANVLGHDSEQDLNTALAKYIDTEF